MPVSIQRICILSASFHILIVTSPFSGVNLIALDIKLLKTCNSLSSSPKIKGKVSGISILKLSFLVSNWSLNLSAASSVTTFKETLSFFRISFPDSIRERSKRSPISLVK